MRHFVYTYSERTPRNGHVEKTVRIYRIVRNKPTFVCEETDTFVSEFQLVMGAMQRAKALPAKAFEKHPSGCWKYGYAYLLELAGIASVTRI